MNVDRSRVALITHAGGAHVSAYLSALATAKNCESVMVLDSDGRFVADAKRVLGDRFAGFDRSIETGLKRFKPHLALVTMEAALAPPIIRMALNHDCHVFAEKPACIRAADFQSLAQLAEQKHRFLMLAFANRLNPEVRAARDFIAGGQIGKIFGTEMYLVADQTRLTNKAYHQQWFAQKKRAGGGHLAWLGIHWLDLAMYVTNSSIVQCSGMIGNVGGQPIDIEDSAVATLQFDNGSLGTITSGYYLDRGYHSHMRIWGSQGWILIEPTQKKLTTYTTKGPNARKVIEHEYAQEPRGYTPFVHEALAAVERFDKPPVSTSESLRAIRTLYAIYDAAEEEKSVRVEPKTP